MDTIIIESDNSSCSNFAHLDSSSGESVTETMNADNTMISSDLLEGTLYRTELHESKIIISFLSRVLFDMFQSKTHSDFQQNVEKDETTFVSKCSTHIKGVKCELKLDSHFKTVELSGMGYKLWRNERFPKVIQSLFKRFMQGVDSQYEESSTGQPLSDDLLDSQSQSDASFTGDSQLHEHAPSECRSESRSSEHTSQSESHEDFIQQPEPVPTQKSDTQPKKCLLPTPQVQVEFTAEKMGSGTATCENVNTLPIYTSTPIVQRQDGMTTESSEINSLKISSIMNKIAQLDSSIKSLKTDVLLQMELKLNDLKSTLVKMIESTNKQVSYADSVKSQQRHVLPSECRNVSQPSAIDEEYGNLSDGSFCDGSSQTRLKQVFTPGLKETVDASVISCTSQQTPRGRVTPPQPVTVRITNRAGPINDQQLPPPRPRNRTLLVGDSLLKAVNTKGLKNGTTVCAKGGAKVKDIWTELSVYNLGTFDNIVICVGGNDASIKTDINQFEDNYDELLSFITVANPECCVHICQVLPRGDVDVSNINTSIRRVADHWKMHNVKCIVETYDLLFDKHGMPASRYYGSDGIHLAHPGTRRMLDAMNRNVNIVDNFQFRVMSSSRQQLTQDNRPGNGRQSYRYNKEENGRPQTGNGKSYRRYSGNSRSNGTHTGARYEQSNRQYTGNSKFNGPNRGHGQNTYYGQSNGQRGGRRLCFGCNMPGHEVADCWYSQ